MRELLSRLVKGRSPSPETVKKKHDAPVAEEKPTDFSSADIELYDRVRSFTLTSEARVFQLARSVEYLVRNDVPGAIVECGVWRGGSIMAAALTLLRLKRTDRDIWLYDTFEGMPPPDARDKRFDDMAAGDILKSRTKSEKDPYWAYATLDDVKTNLASTGYPGARIHYVQGKVEDTIPGEIPEQIALLRLDTDWYSSTMHELVHLYPRLSRHGVMIVDDYGWWKGQKQAVDEYFGRLKFPPLLHRIDAASRACVKPAE